MAGSKSDYLENKLLEHVFTTDFAAPATLYAALLTAAPNDAGGGTECTGGSYARVAVTRGAAAFTVTANAATNDADITFPAATGNWGTVVAMAFYDAATAGNLLYWDDFTGQAVNSGQTAKIVAGDFDVTED